MADPAPVLIGKYRLERMLAVGGMAQIFLAHEGDKPVVLKRVLPELTRSGDFVRMFLDEARLAALLHHPNIVNVTDFGEVNGISFLVMEHLEGDDLGSLLERRRAAGRRGFPPLITAMVAAAVCEGLHYAHTLNGEDGRPLRIVHRDVTPSNIFMTTTGHIKLLDFGIAKAEGKSVKTRQGFVKGKLLYMSPEQLSGEEIDARSDLFTLGNVMYELLTGERPFARQQEFQTVEAIYRQSPKPLQDTLPNLPTGLSDIVFKALEKDAHKRFGSALEMHQALNAFVESFSKENPADQLQRFIRSALAENPRPAGGAKKPESTDSNVVARGEPDTDEQRVPEPLPPPVPDESTDPERATGRQAPALEDWNSEEPATARMPPLPAEPQPPGVATVRNRPLPDGFKPSVRPKGVKESRLPTLDGPLPPVPDLGDLPPTSVDLADSNTSETVMGLDPAERDPAERTDADMPVPQMKRAPLGVKARPPSEDVPLPTEQTAAMLEAVPSLMTLDQTSSNEMQALPAEVGRPALQAQPLAADTQRRISTTVRSREEFLSKGPQAAQPTSRELPKTPQARWLLVGVGALAAVPVVLIFIALLRSGPPPPAPGAITPLDGFGVDAGRLVEAPVPSLKKEPPPAYAASLVVNAAPALDAGAVEAAAVEPAPRPSPGAPLSPPKIAAPRGLNDALPLAPGFLSLRCSVACRIHIDGRDTNKASPLDRFALTAGAHKLKLVNPQLGTQVREVQISSGKTTDVYVEF